MARALYRSVTANVYHPGTPAQRSDTINKAWKSADVLKMQEAQGSSAIIRKLPGARFFIPSGAMAWNPIAWRDTTFKLIAKGTKMLYTGAVNPHRNMVWVLLEHRVTKARVLEFNLHQIHQAFTKHPEREPAWHQIQEGLGTEMTRVLGVYGNKVPAVVSADWNRGSDFSIPNLVGEHEVTGTPASFGNSEGHQVRYDRFFYVGDIAPKSNGQIITPSDHDAIYVNFELTDPGTSKQSSTVTPVASPAPTDKPHVVVPKPQPPVQPPADLRRRATFRSRPKWRFFATRFDGTTGDGQIIHPDLPLTDPEIEDVLTGHNGFSATIQPEFASLLGPDDLPVLQEWGAAIWAEESGNIHGGGILTHSGFNGPDWKIECTGLTGYSTDTPYASATFFVEEDPLNIFRHIWTHIQSQPHGNVGLEVDDLLTGLEIGSALSQGEFDTQNGPLIFEDGPYKLAWYQDHNLDENLSKLAADNGFDWHEEHFWVGDVLHHKLRLGYPHLGYRRSELRFVVGENIHVMPEIEHDGATYADEVWMLGAGEGSAMLRGTARKDINRLRRVAVVSDPSLKTQTAVTLAANRELSWRYNLETIDSVTVIDHPHADITSLQVGDEIFVQGKTVWILASGWYRVLSRSIKPFSPDRMTLTLARADSLGL